MERKESRPDSSAAADISRMKGGLYIQALKSYMEETGCNLDEAYNKATESKFAGNVRQNHGLTEAYLYLKEQDQ